MDDLKLLIIHDRTFFFNLIFMPPLTSLLSIHRFDVQMSLVTQVRQNTLLTPNSILATKKERKKKRDDIPFFRFHSLEIKLFNNASDDFDFNF